MCHHCDLHVLTHSLPTRRSSDLITEAEAVVQADLAQDLANLLRAPVDAVNTQRVLQRGINGVARMQRGVWILEHHLHRPVVGQRQRSEEQTYELQSPIRNAYAVFCLKNKKLEGHTAIH